MAPTAYSIWADEDYDKPNIAIDCLLPNGMLVPLIVGKHDKISRIKQDLWKEAAHYPLFDRLSTSDAYVFMCITETAVKMELLDETRRLSDVRPFQPLLKLIPTTRKNESKNEKVVNGQINILLGKVIGDMDYVKTSEASDFRRNMGGMCERVAREKESQDWLEQAICLYPPDVAVDPELPAHLEKRLRNRTSLLVSVSFHDLEVEYKLWVDHWIYPIDLIQLALDKRSNKSGEKQSDPHQFVLKVCGRQEYLLGSEYRLSQFTYIRQSVRTSKTPETNQSKLVIVTKQSILALNPVIPGRGVSVSKRPAARPPLALATEEEKALVANGRCIIDITEKYTLKLHSASNINVENFTLVNLRMCLYHGGDVLCDVINSTSESARDNKVVWKDEQISFDITLQNIPRMARLCLMLYSIHGTGEKREKKQLTGGITSAKKFKKNDMNPLAWVNIPLFDYKGILRVDSKRQLYMWSITDDDMLTDELLNPIGTVESNPQKEEAICLTVSFENYNTDRPIYFPLFDKVLEVAAQYVKQDAKKMQALDPKKVTAKHLEGLRVIIDRDPLEVLPEQDKERVWSLRYECHQHFPQSLPKLLSCVHWNSYQEVATMQSLLQVWQELTPTDALELLDFQYLDKNVRKFAVSCLSKMSDMEICQYLLQFVQALKYESYLECDLVEFLLKRAINNKKIGHFFFWLLRSEMDIPSVSVRFSLILEAYCRGSTHHLSELCSEIDALNVLRTISEHIKNVCRDMAKDKLREEVQKRLGSHFKQSGTVVASPLDPTLKLRALKIEECKSMMSKMRPLWLVWENIDPHGDTTCFIYKKGDDLRQDMLSLQILRIMDSIWQSEGLDLRLNAYGCLPTGHSEGLIEIVTQSNTLANIQKGEGTAIRAAFNKQSLYQWLKRMNPSEKELKAALEEFRLSCAGYCVATYVLGVADRHSDNIMLRKNGQLFHIDFGHILGHFKSKMGVKRERVPFVLTSDFVYVINDGPEHCSANFTKFKMDCEAAYMALRKRSRLLMTLLMMMMNTGIPEVSCLKDIEYLKETLVPHLSDEEAYAHFRAKFKEALASSWTTNVNWFIHNFHVNNS